MFAASAAAGMVMLLRNAWHNQMLYRGLMPGCPWLQNMPPRLPGVHYTAHASVKHPSLILKTCSPGDTVDGRNPAPVDR